ncbi:hypothetical protein D3C76_1003200 [compost metagenome]
MISAVSSITTGVLPAPTPIAGLPELYAALTMPGPPVARIMLMSGWCIRALDSSTDGWSIQPIRSFGAPAAMAACRTISAALLVASLARGCGEKMIALRVFRLIRDLKIAVEVGFVVGTIPQMIPIGSAMVMVPKVSSSDRTPQVFSSL